jgi:hypothetical protein
MKYASKPDKTHLTKKAAEFDRFRFNNRGNMQMFKAKIRRSLFDDKMFT